MTQNNLQTIINNGGATITANGRPVNYQKGWQVSKQDLAIIDLNDRQKILDFINKTQKQLNPGEYLGLWADAGKMYIDKSEHYNSKQEAIKQGLALNQISIFDWKNKTCLYLIKR